MPRLPLLTTDDAPPEVHEVLETSVARFGELLQALAVTAHHPPILDAVMGFEHGLRRARRLESSLRSLVMVKIAAHLGCEFCIDLGSFLGTEYEGLTDRQVLELRDFRTSDAFSDRERLALEYGLAMSGVRAEVDEALFARVRAEFSTEQIVELTAIAAWENYRGRFNRALDLGSHGFTANSVCALPEVD